MLYWKLHDELARGLEDPLININGDFYAENYAKLDFVIPDGVRYTKSIRDAYLYRAMKSIMLEAKQAVMSLPYKRASQILERMFPTMIYDLVFRLKDLGIQLAGKYWILNVTLTSDLVREEIGLKSWVDATLAPAVTTFVNQSTQGPVVIYNPSRSINLPIITTSKIDEIAPEHNFNHNAVAIVTAYDDYAWLSLGGKDILMYSAADLDATAEAWLGLRYIHDVPDVSTLRALNPDTNELQRVEFEPVFYSNIINRALVMAHHDNGELGASYQAIPFIESMQGVSNGSK